MSSSSIRRDIVCLVTTTIDGSNVIGSTGSTGDRIRGWCCSIMCRLITTHRPIYMHLHCSLRCTIQVVTTEDLLYFCTVKRYQHITTDKGFNITGSSIDTILLSQAATISITMDGSFIQIDSCGIACIELEFWIVLGIFAHISIHTTLCTTAIDMAVDGCCTGIDGTNLGSDIHRHITIHQCRFT